MSIKPKSYQEIMNDMVGSMMKSLEVDMYYGVSTHHQKLGLLLTKLGIKSGRDLLPAGLMFESLEATLKQTTFNSAALIKWSDLVKTE